MDARWCSQIPRKIRYTRKTDAAIVALRLIEEDGLTTVGIYKCTVCAAYHVTTRGLRAI